ncbi:hypothetical protein ScPMuIL_018449 [Solemya velum]
MIGEWLRSSEWSVSNQVFKNVTAAVRDRISPSQQDSRIVGHGEGDDGGSPHSVERAHITDGYIAGKILTSKVRQEYP